MAPVQSNTVTDDIDNVNLSGNESDASYDMAEDAIPTNNPNHEISTPRTISEAFKVNEKGNKKTSKHDKRSPQPAGSAEKAPKTKQAHLTSSDSDVVSVTSVRSGRDYKEMDRDNEIQAIEEEEEHFYDMLKDQKVTEYRDRFLQEVNAVLQVLDGNLGETPVGLAGVPQHTRAIAAMFGDDVLKLRQIIRNLQVSHGQVSSNLALHQSTINSYQARIVTEVHSRRKLEMLHLQAVRSAQDANARHEREKSETTRAISAIEAMKTRLEQNIEDYKHQLDIFRSKAHETEVKEGAYLREIATLQACKAGLKRDAERRQCQIAAYEVSLQAAEIEQRRERFSKEEFQKRLKKEESERKVLEHQLRREAAVHEQAIRTEQRDKGALAAEIVQLNTTHQTQTQDLSRTSNSRLQALEAIKVERRAREKAAMDNERLECRVVRLLNTVEEVKSEYSKMAAAESKAHDVTRLENENLRKEIATLKKKLEDTESPNTPSEKHESDIRVAQRENNKLHNELVRTRTSLQIIRAELREYHIALRDAMDEHGTEVEKHKEVVKELEEKLTHFKMQVNGLHKFIKSMVITDGKRVETIKMLYAELTEANDTSEKLKVCLRSPNSSTERRLVAALLDYKNISKASIESQISQLAQLCRKLQPFGEELLKTCSALGEEMHALATCIVLLQEQKDFAETFRKNVRSTITSLFNDLGNDAASQRNVGLTDYLRELELRCEDANSREALEALKNFILTQHQKLEDLNNKYREGLSTLLQASEDKEESTTTPLRIPETRQERAATVARKLLNHEITIQKFTTTLSKQSLTQITTLGTLQNLQQINKALTASHDAALKELRERRDQIVEFEAFQQEWELKEATITAQLNQSQTEVRCLQDLIENGKEEIERLKRQIRSPRPGLEPSSVVHVEDVANFFDSYAGDTDDAGYAGGAEEDGEDT
ncbi:hypothetical protein ONS95_005569 [Cadophora gregata]|uniref:uncharacterized protein n=1 Tax=Cadophora gregata TaxID=51156 RepID=UPI0026DC3068|nr:uncharacterized protein ONS95_005569 [Cadophora gregata]KAK0103552.1 hypothetical protein ONS95_005569 [Cadophora gregata]KAK0107744.1 hypothetical protein ONS96_003542 [Cadophora gregata f. sp. sojae]